MNVNSQGRVTVKNYTLCSYSYVFTSVNTSGTVIYTQQVVPSGIMVGTRLFPGILNYVAATPGDIFSECTADASDWFQSTCGTPVGICGGGTNSVASSTS